MRPRLHNIGCVPHAMPPSAMQKTPFAKNTPSALAAWLTAANIRQISRPKPPYTGRPPLVSGTPLSIPSHRACAPSSRRAWAQSGSEMGCKAKKRKKRTNTKGRKSNKAAAPEAAAMLGCPAPIAAALVTRARSRLLPGQARRCYQLSPPLSLLQLPLSALNWFQAQAAAYRCLRRFAGLAPFRHQAPEPTRAAAIATHPW